MADVQEMNEENVLGMSDEDILNMPEPGIPPVEVQAEPEAEPEELEEEEGNDEEVAEDAESEHEPTAEDGEQESEAEASPEQEQNDEAEEPEGEPQQVKAAKQSKKVSNKKKEEKVTETEVPAVSAENMLKELFAPFKANGKDMSISSIADAKTLMQMGANYNKKMAGLKPSLKVVKMLANNDLLDEEKINYLIDLSNKNPDAIKQLIQDSGVDPLEIDTESSTEYKPNSYNVNDNEVDLDQVLNDIQDTPSFKETIGIISNKWDDSSKKVLLATPALISTINDHVASGIYGQINNIIEQERTLGRLTELSDLEAYKYVGDALQQQGAFNQQPQAAPVTPISQQPKAQDPKLKDKRRAASGTKSTKATKPVTYNPLEMSDEDFLKVAGPI